MAKKYDDFDEADQDGIFDQIFGIISNNRRTFAVVSVTAAVLVLGLILWDGAGQSSEEAASESVPIVRADAGDYKTQPENPGGMEVPYRDSTVFSSDQQASAGGTENILADDSSEEPVSRDKAFAGLNTEGDQPGGAPSSSEAPSDQQLADAGTNPAAPTLGGEVEATNAANAEINKVEAVEPPANDALVKQAIGTNPSDNSSSEAAPILSEEAPTPLVETPKAEEPKKAAPSTPAQAQAKADTKKAASIEPAAGNTAAKGVKTGGSFVQLASVKSTSGAAGEYKKLQAKYSGLSGVKYRTQEANLGAKGTFYRIQAGPMSKDDAARICSSIKSSGGSCLVVTK